MKSQGIPRRELRKEALLWFAIFGPAAAWIAAQQLSFVLSPLFCVKGGHWILYLLTASALAASAAGALAAWRSWSRIGSGEADAGGVDARRHFMAAAGFLLALYFGLAILALAIPQIVHRPCD
jgi:hypothetical protein